MKPLLFFAFLLLFSVLAQAQIEIKTLGIPLAQNSYATKIDSIQNLLNSQTHEDTMQVNRLNDLALLCLFDLQFERGILAAKQARQLYQKLNYPKGEGLYLNFMMFMSGSSDIYYYSSDIYYYFKKSWFYAESGLKEEPNQLMENFSPKNDPQKVILKRLEAVKYFEKVNDKEMMAHILGGIGANYQTLNKTNEGILYIDQAIKLFKETEQPELALMASLNKEFALQTVNKIKEANEVENDVKVILTNIKDVRERAFLNFLMGYFYTTKLHKTKTVLGFENLLKADYELEKNGEKALRLIVLRQLGAAFDNNGMPQKSLDYFNKVIELKIETQKLENIASIYIDALFDLVALKRFDEAKQYLEKARSFVNEIKTKQNRLIFEARSYDASGQILMGQGKYEEALKEFFQANKIGKDLNIETLQMYFNSYIAQCYQKLGDLQKSILFAEKSDKQSLTSNDKKLVINNSLLLSEVYEETGQFKKAFEYLKKYRSLIKEKEEQDLANLAANIEIEKIVKKNEQEKASLEKEKLIKEKENQNQQWWLISIAAALLSAVVLAVILYRNNQNKQKANNLLSHQKEEINLKSAQLEKSLSNLKATQSQLIQSEKLASLGELTAGIAHEIQNPLNFVNNFSKFSIGIAQELNTELNQPHIDKEYVGELLKDLTGNQEKINHHGNRASSIVSGMIEHSKPNTGVRELTDVNKLCDEYFRLASNSWRAKNKEFNVEMITHFDETLHKIEIVPQDIGRVIVNLINNAFYAVNERNNLVGFKNLRGLADDEKNLVGFENLRGYKPTVIVQTSQTASHIEISIKDNGTGMTETVREKVFQPFFTTKPTGSGTGLGLSLAYDIITKGHGGTLKVESKEGVGSEFVIVLPLKN